MSDPHHADGTRDVRATNDRAGTSGARSWRRQPTGGFIRGTGVGLDTASFEAVFDAHYERCVRAARRITRDQQVAEALLYATGVTDFVFRQIANSLTNVSDVPH